MTADSSRITFYVTGEPKGQPRPRAFARKMGDKYVARVFEAGTAEAWKSRVAVAAQPHRPGAPLGGPVRLELYFYLPRPKAHFRAGAAGKGLRADAPAYHVGKPDADNLAKAVLDALTQLGGFWGDDAQVAELRVMKLYADGPAGCRVEIASVAIE